MSLNNLALPAPLLADLYQHVLVEGSARAVPDQNPVPFLGKNDKQILVLVQHTDAAYLPDEELTFLTNVLAACGLGLQDVAIVNLGSAAVVNTESVFAQLLPMQVILFGVSPTVVALSANEPAYQVIQNGHRQVVVAPHLQAIAGSKEAKKSLWSALKQLFSL